MEKICRYCHHFEYGKCYCKEFIDMLSEYGGVDNFRVIESGVLSESLTEFTESLLNKEKDKYSIQYFLNLAYPKMSEKRVSEIDEEVSEIVRRFVKEILLEEIMDKVSDVYEDYEMGNIEACKPSYMNEEGIDVENNFSCKFWR